MHKADLLRIRHMFESGSEAISFANGRKREDLKTDRMLTLSLLKSIEIVGEAAARVSAETRAEFDKIPWSSIVGMRNHLVHGYFDIDLDRVWGTVTEDLPALVDELEAILGEEDG